MGDVRVLNASLEEDDIRDEIIIRGVLDSECLKFIGMSWYQREAGFSQMHNNEIIGAFYNQARVADITLGMRGQRMKTNKDKLLGEVYTLLDKCYCVDGGQRLYAASVAVKKRPDLKIRLGAKVYVGTTEESENELFCILNTTQTRVGPSVLIRNRKKKSKAANVLYALNSNELFALKSRVAWDQRRGTHDLMMGFSLAVIAGALHCHLVGGLKQSKTYVLLDALDILVEKIGEENLRINCLRFFDVIDKAWTIRQLSGARTEPRPHLKPHFLKIIARLFSKYEDFWDGSARHEFHCPERFIRKLRTFPLQKYIVATPIPHDAVYEVLRKHLGLEPIFEPVEEAAE